MKNYVFAAIAAALITTGCNLLMGPNAPQGNGNLSISLGGGTGRSVVDSTEAAGLTHYLEISGPGTSIPVTLPPGTLQYTAQVPPGTYTISVRAVVAEGLVPSGYSAFTTPMLRGIGKTTVTVGGGQTAQAEIHMRTAVEVSTWAQLNNAVSAANISNQDELILLANSFPFTGTITISAGKKITLAVDSGTTTLIRSGFTDAFFQINGGHLFLGDSQNMGTLILDGDGGGTNSDEALIYLYGGNLTMRDRTELRNNVNNHNGRGGGGVRLNNSSSEFIMEGGIISYNKNQSGMNGGGICIDNGTFTMTGGTITMNESIGRYAGGVYVDSAGDFIMTEGTISNNKSTATSGGGGGVFVDGIFTMEGGTISGNTAVANGGGVHVSFSATNFTMRGGTISGNKSVDSGRGGGVYVDNFTFVKGPTSPSGIIYGSGEGDMSNLVLNTSNVEVSNSGHAVYAGTTKRKESTVGVNDTLNSADASW